MVSEFMWRGSKCLVSDTGQHISPFVLNANYEPLIYDLVLLQILIYFKDLNWGSGDFQCWELFQGLPFNWAPPDCNWRAWGLFQRLFCDLNSEGKNGSGRAHGPLRIYGILEPIKNYHSREQNWTLYLSWSEIRILAKKISRLAWRKFGPRVVVICYFEYF